MSWARAAARVLLDAGIERADLPNQLKWWKIVRVKYHDELIAEVVATEKPANPAAMWNVYLVDGALRWQAAVRRQQAKPVVTSRLLRQLGL